jgi:pyridoxine 5-phosphate synthase
LPEGNELILGVNIDHIATVRQARRGHDPDPLVAASLAILGGADGITLHLREDRRHVNDRDLRLMREIINSELNLEMAATEEMVAIARDTRPDMVTIVPEKRQELTTEGGLNLKANRSGLDQAIKRVRGDGIPVSLFINPYTDDIDMAKELSADMVEIHTGAYADAQGSEKEKEYEKMVVAVERALAAGLKTNAGHGLNYSNVKPVARITGLRGLYIGHSIVSRAVLVGFEKAVRQMKELIDNV